MDQCGISRRNWIDQFAFGFPITGVLAHKHTYELTALTMTYYLAQTSTDPPPTALGTEHCDPDLRMGPLYGGEPLPNTLRAG